MLENCFAVRQRAVGTNWFHIYEGKLIQNRRRSS